MEWLSLVLAALCACSTVFLLKIATAIWWKPRQAQRCFESQGIRGPPYKLFYGNAHEDIQMLTQAASKPMPWSHDIVPRVFPHIFQRTEIYGEEFVCWAGTKPRLNVPQLELIKEILYNKSGRYQPPSFDPFADQLLRQGILGLKGEKWTQHRKIIAPAFYMDVLKGMVPTIVERTSIMLEEWSKLVLSGAEEFEVLKDFRKLTGDIIACTAFGSNYGEGKHIFNMLNEQVNLTVELLTAVYIPGSRFLPTRKNRRHWYLRKEISRCMMQVIETRERTAGKEDSGSYGNDLLGLLMSAKIQQVGGNLPDVRMTRDEIVGECRTFYFAGHETTSILLTWTMILLGIHQEWQTRARREVLEICGKNVHPDADSVNRLKIVGMILNESLRLYPPAMGILRQAEKPVKLGRLSIPAGTQLMISILSIHHDPALWGNDANEFNPGRFSEGIAKAAKHPLAFMPFGFGPRICAGQNFALLEAKVALAMILQRFSFVTSPSYAHAPVIGVTMQPQHGAQVILHMN